MSRFPRHGARLAGALLVGFVSVGPAACGAPRVADTWVSVSTVDRLLLDADNGSVTLVAGDHVVVSHTVRAPEHGADLDRTLDGGELRIATRCRTLLPCSIDTEITVPADVPVALSLGRGEVWGTGVGALDVDLGEGSADIDATGPLSVRVGTGSVRATLAELTTVRATVGHGDIDLQVPAASWHVDASAARLDLQGIVPAETAAGRLELVAPAGTITVRGQAPVAHR